MYYDRDLIYDSLSGEEVAEKLGLGIEYHNGQAECLCPAADHDDKNFGSCKITAKGCRCFACGRTFSLEGMVRESRGIPDTKQGYLKTLQILAGFAGISPGTANVPHVRITLPFSKEQLSLIGLASRPAYVYGITGMSEKKPVINKNGKTRPAKSVRDADGNYLLLGDSEKFSLLDLYKEDQETFYDMVNGKIDEELEKLNRLLMSEYTEEFRKELEKSGITEKALKAQFLQLKKELLSMKQKCLMAA